MKKIGIIFYLFVLLFNNCSGQTQTELTKQEGDRDKSTDDRLTSIYRHILKTYSADTLFIKNLKTAQKAWLRYRELQINAKFPNYSDSHYGSMLFMCVSDYSIQITEDRIHELEQWLIGSKDEDCASSIKNTAELPPYKTTDINNTK